LQIQFLCTDSGTDVWIGAGQADASQQTYPCPGNLKMVGIHGYTNNYFGGISAVPQEKYYNAFGVVCGAQC
jgi:hypothetical protein